MILVLVLNWMILDCTNGDEFLILSLAKIYSNKIYIGFNLWLLELLDSLESNYSMNLIAHGLD